MLSLSSLPFLGYASLAALWKGWRVVGRCRREARKEVGRRVWVRAIVRRRVEGWIIVAAWMVDGECGFGGVSWGSVGGFCAVCTA